MRSSIRLLICALAAVGCDDPAPTTGKLVVDITGLPAPLEARVVVNGPNLYYQVVPATTTLDKLEPGVYTIVASLVPATTAFYKAAIPVRTVTLVAGKTEALPVAYELGSGSINFTVTGLPGGVDPFIVLQGTGFSRTVRTSGVVTAIPAGDYVIRSDTMTSADGDRYGTAVTEQPITVVASLTPVEATTAYSLVSGALRVTVTGLTGAFPQPVRVTGPAGYSANTGVTVTYRGLRPGTYTVTANPVNECPKVFSASQTQQTFDVAIAQTSNASVGYTESEPGPELLNLKIDNAHLVQVVQDYPGNVPIVAGRAALLRVFGIANQCNGVAPKIKVTFSNGNTLVIDAPEPKMRVDATQAPLLSSWNATLPASAIQPGMSFYAEIDPDNEVAEANENDNRFPASGSFPVNVKTVPTVGIRFIPVIQAGATVAGNVSAENVEQFLAMSRQILPVSAFDVDFGAPFTADTTLVAGGGGWQRTLSRLAALRTADGSARYYHGIVRVTYNSGVAGIGYIGGPRTALTWDHLPSGSEIVAHELGHNVGRLHSPGGCGEQFPDAAYPYAGAYIGKHGFDVTDQVLRDPTVHKDIMSYCNLKWISDYTYVNMMDFLMSSGNTSMPVVASNAVQPSLLVWGRIVNGEPILEPAFEISARPQLPTRSGPHRVSALDAGGAELFGLSFAGDRIADLPEDAETFSFAVPLSALRGRPLSSLRLTTARGRTATNVAVADAAADPGTVMTRVSPRSVRVRWDATKFPGVIVRHPVNGQILSIATGGDAVIATEHDELELNYSNRVRSMRQLRRLQ